MTPGCIISRHIQLKNGLLYIKMTAEETLISIYSCGGEIHEFLHTDWEKDDGTSAVKRPDIFVPFSQFGLSAARASP